MADNATFSQSGNNYRVSYHTGELREDTGISPAFEQAVRDTMQELGDLLIRKHKDYGAKNISQSPYGVLRGLITRMWDKMARMVNLTKGDTPTTAENEPLEDSFKDMANYSVIAIMQMRGQWPKE